MKADQQEETPRQAILREQKKEAQQEGICPRCLANAGLRIKVEEGSFCSNCGLMRNPKFNKI